MIDFGAIRPEINSARMYAGPVSGALIAAASAWSGLAAELNSVAIGYDKVITTLSSEEWLGPASASMAEAAAPYVAWMSATAAQAEQAATQARAAAAAYETALTAMVPPPLVAANRAQLAQLISTSWVKTPPRSRPTKPNTARCGPKTPRRCMAMRVSPRRRPR